jgi:AraC-like DNA-binding protein
MTLYLEPTWTKTPGECRVVLIDRLVEELLSVAAGFGASYPCGGHEERLFRVLLDRLTLSQMTPLHLPSPTSAALKRIAAALIENPADQRTIEEWSEEEGITARTLARRCIAETQMSFGRFRQQVRLLNALERLGAGESVTSVAFAVGYEDVSSFIAVFKSSLGTTPAKYFANPRAETPM